MPRRTRIHIDGLPLHIAQRGHNRAACFFDGQDRLACLDWLREALERARCRLHAYVLMTNHFYLLLTPEQADRVPQVLISVGRSTRNHSATCGWPSIRISRSATTASTGRSRP